MKLINSWKELFEHWENEANKYSALIRLRQYFDFQSSIINEPFHHNLLDRIERQGKDSITADVLTDLYSKVRPAMDELNKWYAEVIQDIVEYYRKKGEWKDGWEKVW